jgi:hypothetical protein
MVLLNFESIFCDGGEFSGDYSISNLLSDDEEVYCSTKSTNVNILLRYSQNKDEDYDENDLETEIDDEVKGSFKIDNISIIGN